MPAKIISGDEIAVKIFADVEKTVKELRELQINPSLAVIMVGENPASEIYVEKKRQACRALGIEFDLMRYRETATEKEIIRAVNDLNQKFNVHAILVQLPLPPSFNKTRVISAITPLKDVDGFTAFNIGLLALGKEGIVSCTANAIMKMLESTGTAIEGSNACIVNHSIVVGRPLTQLLLNKNATVTVCNKHTKDLAGHTKQADILVTAVGKPKLITAGMVKPGAVVIDAGISKENGKTVGDVDFEAVKEVASHITPVPGGVGPLTVACLTQNVAKLTVLQRR